MRDQKKTRTSKYFVNVFIGLFSQAWLLSLSLIATPYIVRKLGDESYGLFTLTLVVMGYFSLLDFGFGVATVKYVAENLGRGSHQTLQNIVETSLTFYLGAGLLGSFVIVSTADVLAKTLLRIPPELQGVSLWLFYASAPGFFITMFMSVFTSIPRAAQRVDLFLRWNMLLNTVAILGQVVLLYYGYSLKEMLILNILINSIGMWVYYRVSRRLVPEIRFRFGFDRSSFRSLIGFGSMKLLNQVACQVVFQLDKFLIGLFLPIYWVTYYIVPLSLVQRVNAMSISISEAFFPLACDMNGKKDETGLSNLYASSIKGIVFLVLPMSILIFGFSPEILELWFDPVFSLKSSTVLRLLVISYILIPLTVIPAAVSDAKGRPDIPTKMSLLSAGINLLCAVLLIPRYGIKGAALAVLINEVIMVPSFVLYVNKKFLGKDIFWIFRSVLWKLLASGAVMGAVLHASKGSFQGVPEILLCSGVSGLSYLVMVWLLGTFTREEVERVGEWLAGYPFLKSLLAR